MTWKNNWTDGHTFTITFTGLLNPLLFSQFKTARSSELRQILAKQRDKVDSDATFKVKEVEQDFGFLEEYDKSGYQTDSGEVWVCYETFN